MFKDFLVSFMFLLNIITIKAQWSLPESAEGPNTYTGRMIPCGSVVDVTASPSTCNGCFGVVPADTRNYYLFYAPRNNLRLDFDKSRNYQITATCRGTEIAVVIGLTVIPNFPPRFQDARTRHTITTYTQTNGEVLHLKTLDPENDTLTFTITERPNNGFFSIDGNGVIKAKKNMNTFCKPEDVTVAMSDSYNPAVTRTITMDPGSTVKRVLTDWNRSIVLPENSTVKIPITDALPRGTCVVTTDPARYLDRLDTTTYCPSGSQSMIMTKSGETFDFEKDQPVNISFIFDDGNCPSEPRWLYVKWSDVPDTPVLELDKKEYITDEGWVEVQPEYKIKDDDFNEKHTYSFVYDKLKMQSDFRIDPDTGKIFTPEYFDRCIPDKDVFEFDVRVTDKDGNMSNVVRVTIKLSDINDKRPYFHEPFSRTYTLTDCAQPIRLTTLSSNDDDCEKGTNGKTEFISSKTSSLTLNAQGKLDLVQAPVAGQTEVLTVQSTDKGEPPLVSEVETITLHGIPCPTTAPPFVVTQLIPLPLPDPDPDTKSDANAKATAAATSFSDNPWNIVGAILGGLLGLALLGLLGYLLYRFCGPCCSNLCYRYRNPPLKSNQIKPSKLSGDTGGPGANKGKEGGFVEEEAGFVEGKKGKMIGGYRIRYGGFVEEHAAFSESGYGGGGYGYGSGGGGLGYGYGSAGGGDYGYGGGEGVIVGDGDLKVDDYWKEHYMDKDLGTTPSRKSLPATVDKA
ncbi:cadherin-related hmr-1-like isoform X5 [Patella vulgata]|uniref:cadherin-related hmr-1-like isoform X5 n=1 Tax=Patella vulgata TaxID=6465 RepID=UPI0024A8776E|nr:cadherin-related hmr-1-like isoform X5 [Patella vulgata]